MKKLSIICTLAFAASAMSAGAAAFQASLTPDTAIQAKSTEIDGLTLSVWGENPQHALSLGFVNGSTGDSSGLSWAFLLNYDDSYKGVQLGLVNYSKEDYLGLQLGCVNAAEGKFKGLQWGFVNYTENLHGVQIGFINVAENNPWFTEFPDKLAKGFPIVNWSF